MRRWPSNRLVVVALGVGAVMLAETPFLVLYSGDLEALNGEMPTETWHVWFFVLNALFFAPPLETALLAIPVLLLRDQPIRDVLVAMVAATFLTVLHAPFISNALVVWVPFVIFSYVYVKRRREPFRDGFMLAAGIHAICNFVPVGALLLYRHFSGA